MTTRPRRQMLHAHLLVAALAVLSLSTCGHPNPTATRLSQDPSTLSPVALQAGERLRVVATTNIIGDVVANVGGEQIELTTLMGLGVDPHTYVPTPADTAALHDAHVIFANGADLEANLEQVFTAAEGQGVRIYLVDGLELRTLNGEPDPHVWFDVQNVMHWVQTISHVLSALDPAHAALYEQNAQNYVEELQELDAWIVEQIALIPKDNRKLVTNHPAFGYLADRYGLQQLATIYPVNPSSEPSAQDVAALQDTIAQYGVPAVFSESTVNPKLAQQVAQDTGIQLVPLYTGSLGPQGSGAETYVLMMRYDVSHIVEALR